MFDRYQIVLGYYTWLSLNYNGQFSPEYKRLCRIGRYFKPGMCEDFDLTKPENEIALEVYNGLSRKHHTRLFEED